MNKETIYVELFYYLASPNTTSVFLTCKTFVRCVLQSCTYYLSHKHGSCI